MIRRNINNKPVIRLVLLSVAYKPIGLFQKLFGPNHVENVNKTHFHLTGILLVERWCTCTKCRAWASAEMNICCKDHRYGKRGALAISNALRFVRPLNSFDCLPQWGWCITTIPPIILCIVYTITYKLCRWGDL